MLEQFTLQVIEGPRGEVRDGDWPCIAYVVAVAYQGREIWRGPYFMGVGHVNPKAEGSERALLRELGQDGAGLLCTWTLKPHANFINRTLHAQVAAALAKWQKVAPTAADVLHGLISDGSAYFDAQSHADWCSDLGFDADSIKAHKMYLECCETGRKLTAALGPNMVERLRERLADY